jgi:hypothetical protein
MLKFSYGDLVRVIDVNGSDMGFGTYIDLLDDPNAGLGWRFKVIDVTGEMKYLRTTLWALIPADPDSCNP